VVGIYNGKTFNQVEIKVLQEMVWACYTLQCDWMLVT